MLAEISGMLLLYREGPSPLHLILEMLNILAFKSTIISDIKTQSLNSSWNGAYTGDR